MKQANRIGRWAVCMMLGLSLSSCDSYLKLSSKDPMLSLNEGMTQTEVGELLGKPDFRRFDTGVEEWEYSTTYRTIIVTFEEGRVVRMDAFRTPDTREQNVTLSPPPVVQVSSSRHQGIRNCRLIGDAEFEELYMKVKEKPFSDGKLELLSTVVSVSNSAYTCKQCARLMSLFSFDDDRIKALRILAPVLADVPENGLLVLEALTFSTGVEEARKILYR